MEADPNFSFSASHVQTPQNLPVPLWGGGWCEEMSPVITFWVHSGLEHPLTGTCYYVAFTGGPCWLVQSHLLICFCSFLFCLVWRHKPNCCPGSVWHPVPWAKLGMTWLRASPVPWQAKAAITKPSEKWDMGIPGFFCHKGGMRVVWTHAAERNLGM